ncbi:dienelactone hydrolase [Rhodocytophaga aerolata]|uniref:Dienelactone hydrolase n=1 Tax=Rhodocytophaga aerolata TaxID=455078 RepID=A0ABT8RFB0_9BACT|nr:dienelactone hydrolase [Rhodocytophaga aerolata]MDO1450801.1 dienelactone hydrolase [Rhodocytophaga aerolata]
MYRPIVIVLLLLLPFYSFTQPKPAETIGQRTLTFKDLTRNRPVVTEVWYPTGDSLKASDRVAGPFRRKHTVRNGRLPSARLPLILLSHGTGGGRLTLEWLAQALAEHGFMVAAVDHWGNTYDNKIPLEFLNPWERPLDISFALTALLEDKEFSAVIDRQRIGATGFSFGGYTVIALAGGVLAYDALVTYHKSTGYKELELPEFPGLSRYLEDSTLLEGIKQARPLKDTRIQAFLALSPALGAGFIDQQQVKEINRPLYIIGAQSDSIAPVETNARHFHKLIAGSEYYEFTGKTGHYVMLNEANDDLKQGAPTYFLDDASVSRVRVHEQVSRLAVHFFNAKLNELPKLKKRQ